MRKYSTYEDGPTLFDMAPYWNTPQECSLCKEAHPIIHYRVKQKSSKSGYRIMSHCAKCSHRLSKEKYPKTPSQHLFTSRRKKCSICNEEKDPSSFSSHVGKSDGLRLWCRECDKRKVWLRKFKKCGGNSSHWEHYSRTTHCESCSTLLSEGKGLDRKCQDHDHDSNSMRGVICAWCNFREGVLKGGKSIAKGEEELQREECVRKYMQRWSASLTPKSLP